MKELFLFLTFTVIIMYPFWKPSLKFKKKKTLLKNIFENSTENSTENNEEISNFKAKLHVYVGPMFSSKTSTMLKNLTLIADTLEDNAKICLINSKLDTRDLNNVISSHSSGFKGLSKKITIFSTDKLDLIDVDNYDIIGIDEAQFYPDLYTFVVSNLKKGKTIYCAGLDGDSNMENFGEIYKLLPISDTFTKLNAICKMCLNNMKGCFSINEVPKAAFTCKISKSNSRIDIGGDDKYIAVCREHFILNQKSLN